MKDARPLSLWLLSFDSNPLYVQCSLGTLHITPVGLGEHGKMTQT